MKELALSQFGLGQILCVLYSDGLSPGACQKGSQVGGAFGSAAPFADKCCWSCPKIFEARVQKCKKTPVKSIKEVNTDKTCRPGHMETYEQCLSGCTDCEYIDFIRYDIYPLRDYVLHNYKSSLYVIQQDKIDQDAKKRWQEFRLKQDLGDIIGKTEATKRVKKKRQEVQKQANHDMKHGSDKLLMEKQVARLIQDVRLRWGGDEDQEREIELDSIEKRINEVLPPDLRYALLKFYLRYPPPPVKGNHVDEESRKMMEEDLDKWTVLKKTYGPIPRLSWPGADQRTCYGLDIVAAAVGRIEEESMA